MGEVQIDICEFIGCDAIVLQGYKRCNHHVQSGSLGLGETYELYQLIEEDFLDFIKVVPIDDPAHLTVHSPVLRDIILRSCTVIEIFFKEWAKFIISENQSCEFCKEYTRQKNGKTGARNW